MINVDDKEIFYFNYTSNPSLIKEVIPDGFMIYDTDDFMEDNLRPIIKKRTKSKK